LALRQANRPAVAEQALAPADVLAGGPAGQRHGIADQRHALRPAMPTSRLQAALNTPPQDLLQWALAQLREQGQAAPEPGGWRLSTHEVTLTESQERALATLQTQANGAGMSPLTRAEALKLLPPGESEQLLETALGRGDLIPVSDFLIARGAFALALRQLAEAYAQKGPLSIADIRDLWGTTRKFIVPILEYLDGRGLTRRDGDLRHVTPRRPA